MDFNQRHLSPALGAQWTFAFCKLLILKDWSGRMDLNHRPPGPEPGALARLRYAPNFVIPSAHQFTSACSHSQPAENHHWNLPGCTRTAHIVISFHLRYPRLLMIDIHCHLLPNLDDGAESL